MSWLIRQLRLGDLETLIAFDKNLESTAAMSTLVLPKFQARLESPNQCGGATQMASSE
jgi:hypothetical protein